jgi:hypothetical protein
MARKSTRNNTSAVVSSVSTPSPAAAVPPPRHEPISPVPVTPAPIPILTVLHTPLVSQPPTPRVIISPPAVNGASVMAFCNNML